MASSYVNAMPGNFVAALANFWIDKVSKMPEFERTFEGAGGRMYYRVDRTGIGAPRAPRAPTGGANK